VQNLIITGCKTGSNLSSGLFAGRRRARHRGFIWLALTAGFVLSAASGFAAVIAWGTPTLVSGNTDVTNSGTALYAYAGTATTVNGVTFTAVSSGTTWGNVSFTSFGSYYAAFTATSAPFNALSTAYSNVLSSGAYGGATTGTVTLNGLTYGRAYTVQIWVNDSRALASGRNETASSSGGNSVALDYNNTDVAGGVGRFSIGTFVANSTSQTFTLASSSSVQLNAISVRDNGYVGAQSSYTPSRFNLAKYQPVFTDSTNGTQNSSYLSAGFVNDNNCWVSDNSGPHWAGVTFPFPVTVGSAQLAMGLNNSLAPTVFYFQYLTNGNWATVPGSTVVGNTNVERNVVFSTPITATSFRVYDSIDGTLRIRQLALYPPNGTNGYPFGTDFAIDLARKQPTFATANTYGNWPLLAADGLISPSSSWQTTLVGSNALLINLQFTNRLGSAHLYSGATGVPPLTNFVLQYWTGSAWANIPGGSISGNTSSALVIPFTTPVTTTKVQLVFTNSGTSAVQELCIFPANSNGGYSLGTGIISNTPVSAKYDTYSDSFYYLSNSAAAQAIVESNSAPVLGAAAIANLASQYQVLLNYDNGTYRLINRTSGLCLAGAQLTTNAGAALVENTYAALSDQDWYLQSVDGVNFYLVNQFSGLALDAQGGVLVQSVQTNSASQFWQLPLARIYPKKGIAGSSRAYQITFESDWTYGWWYVSDPKVSGVNYFPMDPDTWYRNSTVAGNLWGFQPGWRTKGYSLNILGYNEPDMVGQADIDATNGAIYYMNDHNLDLPMAGPAAGNVNGTWNQIFYGYITNWGGRVDYLPAHEYPGNNSSASSSIWIGPLQTAYNTYGYPMWMTEWSVVDWSGTGNWSEEDNYNALAEFLWRAESIPWLRKYSLFVFTADTNSPMAVNPWTRTTPAPRSNAFDSNGNLTPFGELYAAWDNDANVETNKIYYVHNSGTRKRLRNTLGANADAIEIRVTDTSTKWTLQSAGANLYYVVSSLDGRRLSYNGTTVGYVAAGTVGTAVQWSLTANQYGWFYLDHPSTAKRLQLAYNNSTAAATYTMVATTTTTTAVQWRFIATLPPPAWTGFTDTNWSTPGNWSSVQTPISGQPVTFNDSSAANLNTVLDTNFNVSSVIVTAPTGPVSIGGTNTLTLGSGFDLSAASQNLTITAPVTMNGNQSWNVAAGRTLSVNGGMSDNSSSNALTISGGGTVVLGGTATYSGGTVINSNCTLQVSAANVLPNATNVASNSGDVSLNGILNLNGTAQAINGFSGSGLVDNTAVGVAALTVGVNNIGGTFSGTIQDTGGNLTLVKNGSGSLTISGTNAYAGGTTLNLGTLSPKNNSAFGTGALTVNGGIIFNSFNPGLNLTFTNLVTLNGGTLRTGGGQATTKNTWAASVTLTTNSTVQSDGGTIGNTFTGGLNLGNGGYTLTVVGNGNNSGSANNFNSVISGGPNATLQGNSSGLIYLNAANTFSGTVRSGYSLVLQNTNALQNATLDMNAADTGSVTLINNTVIGALTGSRSLSFGSSAVAIGNNNSSTTYGGALSGSGSLTKIGAGWLTLSGTNTFTGNTTISAGALAVSGSGSLASTNLTVAGGAMLDVSGLTTAFALGSSRTLTNSSPGAVFNGANNCSVGTLSLVTDGINPSFIQTNGTMTISASTVIRVNNTGATLTSGIHPLIAAATTGNPGTVTGALPAVVLTGNGAVAATALQLNGAGGLDLIVASTIASNPTNINFTFGSGTLTLTWPADHLGWIAQSNAVDLSVSNFWFDIMGSQTATNLVIPVNPAAPQVYYRLRYPF
jgi:autotransporter-associated beta strand protein